MEDIAEQLKITRPALYHYFSSKEDILVDCYSYGISSILARLEHANQATGSGLEKNACILAGLDRSGYHIRVRSVRRYLG